MSVVFMISGATDSCEITLITCSPIVTSSFAQNGGKFLFLIQGKKKSMHCYMFFNRTDQFFGNVIATWPQVLVRMQQSLN